MKRAGVIAAALLASGTAAAWWLTAPRPIDQQSLLQETTGNAAAGEQVFWAGGCASCHATPVDGKRAKGENKLQLGGGVELDVAQGVFRAPNISPHQTDGIGNWTTLEFVNAMKRGVSPSGKHYYPAFPYTSYARMTMADVIDLKAFLDTLPAVEGQIADHSLNFPWSLRRGVGLWKRLYLNTEPVARIADENDKVRRGRELVEGAGHCGECHTERDVFGGLNGSRWLAGAPNPEATGRVPNITPAGKNTAEWSAADISYFLESGFTPDFDTVGGTMVAVQENMAMLPAADREAIAAYLKAIPAVP